MVLLQIALDLACHSEAKPKNLAPRSFAVAQDDDSFAPQPGSFN